MEDKSGNIAYCPYWIPGRDIKKCNHCLELEAKVKELEGKLELALSVLTFIKGYLSERRKEKS